MLKNLFICAGIALSALCVQSQTINFTNGKVTYNFPAEIAGEMTFEGENVEVAGRIFNLSEWSQMKVSDNVVKSNIVEVKFADSSASVVIAGNVAQYVDVRIEGGDVAITQSDEVSANNCGEITYQLQGECSSGSFTLNGSYKSTIELNGLTLTNPAGAALSIQNGKRIALSAKNGTVNTLTDGSGSQKGAIECKGHLELKGKGELNVKGNKSHAIYAKEYVEIKNLTLNINGSVKDGVNCAQYFLMESGTLNILNPGDDGIQTTFKDDADREVEDTGTITISGGTLSVSVSADATKCLKADADVIINGGNVNLTSTADGIWDSAKNKTKASSCIGADGDVAVKGGEIRLTASGSGGKGISCDGTFTMDGGDMKISTTGGLLVYSNGALNHNYTGNAERIASDNKSSAKGIKGDSGVIINDGTLYVTTATNNAEGIESKKNLEISGGTIFVKGYDDGINASNDLTVSGGDLTVISIVGDGLDSNGNLYIKGGYIRTMGSGGMEMGLDAATESGCAVYITGGTLMAFGGSNTYPSKSGSTQAFVNTSGAIIANSEIILKSGDTELARFTVPAEYNSSASKAVAKFGPGNGPGWGGWNPGGGSGNGSLMISCPEMSAGQTYSLINNTSTASVTAKLTGSGR